jgi:dihydroorotase
VHAAAAAAPDELVITRPDDWHLHVRDGAGLQSVVPHTASTYGRAIIMPNLVPPVTTAAAAATYRERVLAAVPPPRAAAFTPLMTCYLTDNTPPEEVHRAKEVRRGGSAAFPRLVPASPAAGCNLLLQSSCRLLPGMRATRIQPSRPFQRRRVWWPSSSTLQAQPPTVTRV